MAQLFAVKTNSFYQKPKLEVVLMDADCIESLLRIVSGRFEKFGITPTNVCVTKGTVAMQFESWELEVLKTKRFINDFFKMYGKGKTLEISHFYAAFWPTSMDFPVEALMLLEEAIADQCRQDFC